MRRLGAQKLLTVQLAGRPQEFLSHRFEREVEQKGEACSTTGLPSGQYQRLYQAKERNKNRHRIV